MGRLANNRIKEIVGMYLVAFAKIVEDKRKGLHLESVCFGGIGQTPDEADDIARACTNMAKGATVVPKVFQLDRKLQAIDILYDASEKFEKLTNSMLEANDVLNKNQFRRKK